MSIDVQTRLPTLDKASFVDDSAYSITTDNTMAFAGLVDETTVFSLLDGQIATPRITPTRLLQTKLIGDFAGADIPLSVDGSGNLTVSISGSFPSALDDNPFNDGPAGDLISPIGALVEETVVYALTDGRIGAPRMTPSRLLKTKLIGDFGGTDVALAVDGSGSLTVTVPSKADNTVFSSTDLVSPLGAIVQEIPGPLPVASENNVGVVRMTSSRILKVKLIGDDGTGLVDIPIVTNSSGHVIVGGGGTAGTPAPEVVTIQGISGGTAVSVQDSSSKLDDGAFAVGDRVLPIGFFANETSPDSVNESDVGIPRMTLDRKILTRTVGARDQDRLNVDYNGNAHFKFGDSESMDAMGRFRTSESHVIFDSKAIDNDNNDGLFWDYRLLVGGTATHVPAEACWDLTIPGATLGATSIRQTRQRFSNQSGKSFQVFVTFILATAQTGLEQTIGYYDDNNGVFFEISSTSIRFRLLSSVSGGPVFTNAIQGGGGWNLDDLDGSGPSGYTLDFTKIQELVIDFQWSGSGRIRIGFVIDGKIIYAHQFLNANVIAEVFMSSPNLPLRFEIEEKSGTTVGPNTLKAISASIISEGGYNPKGVIRSAFSGGASATNFSIGTLQDSDIAGTFVPILSIRLLSGPLFTDVSLVKGILELLEVNMIITTSADSVWRIEFHPYGDMTAGSWTSTATNANSEYSIDATFSSAGEILYITPQIGNTSFKYESEDLLRVGLSADSSPRSDILTISVARTSSAVSAVVDTEGYCSMVFKELL